MTNFTFSMADLRFWYGKDIGGTEVMFVTYKMPNGGEIKVDLIPMSNGKFGYAIKTPNDVDGKRHLTGFQTYTGEALTGFQVLQAMIDDWAFILYDFEKEFPGHYFYVLRDGSIIMLEKPLLYLSVGNDDYHSFKPAFYNSESLTKFYNSIFQSNDLSWMDGASKRQGVIREIPSRRRVFPAAE